MTIPLEKKVVMQIPLEELWTSTRALQAGRVRRLGASEITSLLQSSVIHFVVADCGKPLSWVPENDTFSFWKTEAKSRIVEPGEPKILLDNYQGAYCYVASEWIDETGAVVVLLEKHH